MIFSSLPALLAFFSGLHALNHLTVTILHHPAEEVKSFFLSSALFFLQPIHPLILLYMQFRDQFHPPIENNCKSLKLLKNLDFLG
jgi:hypothetical protein